MPGRSVSIPNTEYRIPNTDIDCLANDIQAAARHTQPDTAFDLDRLYDAARRIELIDSALRWQDWTRRSSRQQTRMQLGGLLGHLTLAGDGLPDLWPLLWLGQHTHIGKGASFGLGRYRL